MPHSDSATYLRSIPNGVGALGAFQFSRYRQVATAGSVSPWCGADSYIRRTFRSPADRRGTTHQTPAKNKSPTCKCDSVQVPENVEWNDKLTGRLGSRFLKSVVRLWSARNNRLNNWWVDELLTWPGVDPGGGEDEEDVSPSASVSVSSSLSFIDKLSERNLHVKTKKTMNNEADLN